MTIPTRWHKPVCDRPQVVIDGNIPHCRSCGSNASWLLQKAADQPALSYSGIKLPEEAPIGRMNLWWPPCVSYTCDDAPRAQRAASSKDAASLTERALDSSLSDIYTSTLGKGHFRLLYLSGSRLINSPIHGDLVEYQRDNCHEYETTSYTWGGEEGDATPCRPAYFGDFWDAMFLTRNCWSLLRYLRPEMGTRLVWVDAICINQNSIQERGAQVSSMPQIYRKCMRVVIYAGDHLVRKEEQRFRQTIRHDDITKHGDISPLDDSVLDIRGSILQSRYISRLWIIQELILAPHAILALKNHDVYLSNNFLHCISRKEDGRKWLEFMGQDYKLRQTTLYEGLRKTGDSQATDPRDKIFGILGILGANPTCSGILPDYSLSMRDCVIGAMALTMINSKEIWPLLHAHTSDTTSGSPSWVPSLDEITTWTDEEAPPSLENDTLKLRMSRDGSARNVLEGWDTAIHLRGLPKKTAPPHLESVRRPRRGMKSQVLLFGSEIPWYQNASIDSSCGALTLQLVRLFDRPHKIVEHLRGPSGSHFLVEGLNAAAWFFNTQLPGKPERPCHMFMAFRAPAPNLDIRPEVFPPRLSDMCLVLAAEAEAPGTFSLVSCFRVGDAMFLSASPPPLSPPFQLPSEGIHRQNARGLLSLFDTLHNTLNYNARERRLGEEIRDVDAHPRPRLLPAIDRSEAMQFDMIVPGQGSTASGFLQLSLSAARAGEPATVTEEFRRAYAACLQSGSAEFNPALDGEYVWFTLVNSDSLTRYWDSLRRHISDVLFDPRTLRHTEESVPLLPWRMLFDPWFDLQIPGIGRTQFNGRVCRDYRSGKDDRRAPIRCTLHQDFEPRGHMGLHYWLPCCTEPRELQMPVRARMPLRKVVEAIRATGLNWYHRYLLAFSEKVSEDVEALLERGPQPKDSNIYLHDWPKPLVDDLGFVWRTESVTFV